ncbi:MAG TPA: hypothetical protein VHX64_04630, partial [Caulobacteraceae bacterium]|nr:hypothetical protein [Caulobacteraceae bacterium]
MARQLSRRARIAISALVTAAAALALLATGPAARSAPAFDPHNLDGAWDRPPPPTPEAGLDPT